MIPTLSLPIGSDSQSEGRRRVTRQSDLSTAGTIGGLGIYQSPFGYGGLNGGYGGGGFGNLGYGGFGGGGLGKYFSF